MAQTKQLEEALALALQLPPADRLRLVERVVASVEQALVSHPPGDRPGADERWGQSLIWLLDALDMSDWKALEIDDPVEWVKRLRQQDASRLDAYREDSQ